VHSAGVELTLRQVSGLRPFVGGEVNGHRVDFMVHSNASFGAMVTHDVAARARLRLAPMERPDYGIEAVGTLGRRGRTSAVTSLQVDDDLVRDVEVAVFDVPQDPPVEGMLGIGWLRERGVVVDLGRRRLHVGGPPSAGVRPQWDESWHAYTVATSVRGQAARFVVSTVAGVVVDALASDRLGLATGPVVDLDGGPTGTVVEVRRVEGDWSLDLAGRPRQVTETSSWDIYAYAERPRPPTDWIDGFLGCEFLVEEGAIVDFGRGTLSLHP
jgi:gag-polyprotein putative aspartyl protease